MRLYFYLIAFVALFFVSCKKNDGALSPNTKDRIALDSVAYQQLTKQYKSLHPFQAKIDELYERHNGYLIWYDTDGRVDLADVLINEIHALEADGAQFEKFPYTSELETILADKRGKKTATTANDFLLSAAYIYYTSTIVDGLNPQISKRLGWFLPREKRDYAAYLDTLLNHENLAEIENLGNIKQYYKLRDALKKYHAFATSTKLPSLTMPTGTKQLKVGDTAAIVPTIKKAMQFIAGYQGTIDSPDYDEALKTSFEKLYARHYATFSGTIDQNTLKFINLFTQEAVTKIQLNMERCRWVPTAFDQQKNWIAVNIPAYHLWYKRDGKNVLESRVVVGKEAHETVIFSGNMSYLAFSPYWNVPTSILENEIKPAIERNPNYLKNNHMEWVGNRVRQIPGDWNSLGRVKFMFPNQNNIYLHDSPAKALYNKDDRAFSHGCVRVEKAQALAEAILADDPAWTKEKIAQAMNQSKESTYTLKEKIPVYLVYFTAWVDDNNELTLYEDVYKRDAPLQKQLYSK